MGTNLIEAAVKQATTIYRTGQETPMRLRVVDIISALEGARLTLEDCGDILTVVARKVEDDYNVEPYPEDFCEDAANLATEIQGVADDLYKLAGEEPPSAEDLADAAIDADWYNQKG